MITPVNNSSPQPSSSCDDSYNDSYNDSAGSLVSNGFKYTIDPDPALNKKITDYANAVRQDDDRIWMEIIESPIALTLPANRRWILSFDAR